MSDTFDSVGFKPEYRWAINPEFPGTGSWDSPTFEFPQSKTPNEPFRSPWGAPLVIRVEPEEGTGWTAATVALGTSMMRTPRPRLVETRGSGFLESADESRNHPRTAGSSASSSPTMGGRCSARPSRPSVAPCRRPSATTSATTRWPSYAAPCDTSSRKTAPGRKRAATRS